MALLGGQLVITLIMTCVIQKLSPHFSFAQWILCSAGLKRYLHPKDEDLKALSGIPKEKNKGKNYMKEKSTFLIPKSLEIPLETAQISSLDVVHLRYYEEYKWLIDFSIYTLLVYTSSEVFHYYFPRKGEINLSLIWCAIVVLFAIKYLSSLTWLYFKNDQSIGERSMCIVAFLIYLLIAMIVLIIDENILETGLEEAYDNFYRNGIKFLSEHGLPTTNISSKVVLQFFIAIFCGFLGSLFTFPGLRMSQMHSDSLRYCKEDKIMQLMLNLSFVLPFILVTLWIRPASRDYLTVRVFEGMNSPLLTSHSFEVVRLLTIIFVVFLRFCLLPVYLQSYLNIAYDRVVEMRKEAGRISNVDLQRKISSIFYYLCVVILQFAAPLIICFFLTILYKNLSGISWVATVEKETLLQNHNDSIPIQHSDDSVQQDYSILQTAADFQITLCNLREVFNVHVWRGVLGFLLWWSFFILFSTSAFGLVYHSYFTKV